VQISTFIFDLDGTLSDPLAGMADSINYALDCHGFEERDPAELAEYVGPPLEDALAKLTGSDDKQLMTNLVLRYRERYLDSGFAQNEVYEGIPKVLNTLEQLGKRMGVCTSKPQATASKILRLFEIDRFFSFTSGGDIGVKKSQQLETLLSDGNIDQNALMIGDRAVDISAAKSNSLRSAAAFWGYGSERELTLATPDFNFEAPQDIVLLLGAGE